ncbi:SMI1/KNR4 family protein [Paenibacillus albidus]|uniref:SMI1/KNR4 family protein n=1 Tax=Paenibacillus albidus TaxID=2041023 RepID=UPI003570C765
MNLEVENLEAALNELKATHRKFGLPGSFANRNNASLHFPAAIGKSKELEYLLNHYEPAGVKLETGFTPLKLWAVEGLERAQLGYRRVKDREGWIDNPEWPEEYVVFADDVGGGKPVIAVINREGTPVYAAHDAGQAFPIAASLADFVNALSAMISVVYGEFEIFEIGDDDGLYPGFEQRFKEVVEPVLGAEYYEGFWDYFYG